MHSCLLLYAAVLIASTSPVDFLMLAIAQGKENVKYICLGGFREDDRMPFLLFWIISFLVPFITGRVAVVRRTYIQSQEIRIYKILWTYFGGLTVYEQARPTLLQDVWNCVVRSVDHGDEQDEQHDQDPRALFLPSLLPGCHQCRYLPLKSY